MGRFSARLQSICSVRNVVVTAFAIALAGWLVSFCADALSDAPSFRKDVLTIQHADGTKVPLTVELALTPEQKEYGLMFRHSMPEGLGMLFLWDQDQLVNMWMKNTYLALDMLFVRQDGAIVKIINNAEPLSVAILSSDQPVRGVIELKAGVAERQGIKVGDRVAYSAFAGAP